jgi:hypothetical protein
MSLLSFYALLLFLVNQSSIYDWTYRKTNSDSKKNINNKQETTTITSCHLLLHFDRSLSFLLFSSSFSFDFYPLVIVDSMLLSARIGEKKTFLFLNLDGSLCGCFFFVTYYYNLINILFPSVFDIGKNLEKRATIADIIR